MIKNKIFEMIRKSPTYNMFNMGMKPAVCHKHDKYLVDIWFYMY